MLANAPHEGWEGRFSGGDAVVDLTGGGPLSIFWPSELLRNRLSRQLLHMYCSGTLSTLAMTEIPEWRELSPANIDSAAIPLVLTPSSRIDDSLLKTSSFLMPLVI